MKWDSKLYDDKHSFVSEYGKGLLEFVPNSQVQRILDIGCGTGLLTEKLSKQCGYVLGTDGSAEMISKAKEEYPAIDFAVADALTMDFTQEWDVVFSNAVFHWILHHDQLLENIYRSLKPSGKLICEFGAYGNIKTIESAFAHALHDFGYPYHSNFNFPTVEKFGHLLKKNGFIIDKIYDYDRPTPLQGGESGLINWVKQFFGSELEEIPLLQHKDIFVAMESKAKSKLWNGEEWVADYKRLRVVSHIE